MKFAGAFALLLGLSSCVPWTTRPIGQNDSDAAEQSSSFDAATYGKSMWDSRIVPTVLAAAVDLKVVLQTLAENPAEAEKKYGHREGEGPYNFIVKGSGRVLAVNTRSRVGSIDLPNASLLIGPVIPGTALRDAVGFIHFDQFTNQIEYAEAGNALNKEVETRVLDPIRSRLRPGQMVSFVGVFTVPLLADATTQRPQIVPVQLQLESTQ